MKKKEKEEEEEEILDSQHKRHGLFEGNRRLV